MSITVHTANGQWQTGRDWNGGGTVKDLIAFVSEEMEVTGKDLQIVDAIVVPQHKPAWELCDREVELVDTYKRWGWFPTPELLTVWIDRGEIG